MPRPRMNDSVEAHKYLQDSNKRPKSPPLSPNSIARLRSKWQGEYEEWACCCLEDLSVVYLWVDGVYVKAGLRKGKAALLVTLASQGPYSNLALVEEEVENLRREIKEGEVRVAAPKRWPPLPVRWKQRQLGPFSA